MIDANATKSLSLQPGEIRLREALGLTGIDDRSVLYERVMSELGVNNAQAALSITQMTLLASGADSKAIIYVECDSPYVIKIGATPIIEKERRFLEEANSAFPRIFEHGQFSGDSWYAMEAAGPESAEDLVFDDRIRGSLRSGWFEVIQDISSNLKEMMEDSIVDHTCNVAQYHYTKRVKSIFNRNDFLQFAEKCLGSRSDINRILQSGFVLNGERLNGLAAFNDVAAAYISEFPSMKSAKIHGDFHLKNVLRRRSGREYLLIDPRLQWDDQPIDMFGFSDPVYDASTMLHSVAAMTQILANIEAGTTDQLCAISFKDGILEIDLKMQIDDVIQTFLQRSAQLVPTACLTRGWDVRLLTGAANALLGWLKYENSIQTKAAWAAVYAIAAVFLRDAANRALAR